MSRAIYSLVLIAGILAFASCAALTKYNIDTTGISVGGLSSGGFMAVQMHFAFSKSIKSAAIVAGGPFWCSQGNQSTALMACMSMPASLNVSVLNKKVTDLAAKGSIDPVSNISGSKVYLFSGTKDDVVKPDVMKTLQKQYENFGASVTSVYNVPAEHAYITTNYGGKCAFKGTPYINNCDYNMAFDSFTAMYGPLNPQVAAVSANLKEFSQSTYITSNESMGDKGYVYVPTACQNGAACKLSIQFHGCSQTLADIGTQYVTKLGINEVAEANNIIVLYPQAKSSMMNPSNMNGCWDWFNYTGSLMDTTSYVTKSGKQMASVWKMVTAIVGSNPENLSINAESE